MRAPTNVLKLYSSSSTYDPSTKTYSFDNLSKIDKGNWKWLRVRAIDFAMSNPLFDGAKPLLPAGILKGDYDSITLPPILQTLFGATAVAIPPSTNIISLSFAGATTLNISQWSDRDRYYLGSGNLDLSIPGAGTITFPYPCDLGGDLEYSFEFSNHLGDAKPIVTQAAPNAVPPKPGDPCFVFTAPGDGNMLDFVFYRPDDYILNLGPSPPDLQSFDIQIKDQWNNVLDMGNRQFFIRLELYE